MAEREARDAAPGDAQELADGADALSGGLARALERPRGLVLPLRPRALAVRAAAGAGARRHPAAAGAIGALNERRSGRSDRSADFRVLAGWFAACADDAEAHRLARAAFALNPARHFALIADGGRRAWPPARAGRTRRRSRIHPRLREYGEAAPRGPLPRVRDRGEARRLLEQELAQEAEQVEAARLRLATGRPTRLSELGALDPHAFGLFLGLLGEALAEQPGPEATVERQTGDGLLRIRLEPLGPDSRAEIRTPHGVFAGRDHLITITPTR